MGFRRIEPRTNRPVRGWVETISKTGFYRFFALTIRIEIGLKVLPRRCIRARILTHGLPDF